MCSSNIARKGIPKWATKFSLASVESPARNLETKTSYLRYTQQDTLCVNPNNCHFNEEFYLFIYLKIFMRVTKFHTDMFFKLTCLKESKIKG